MASVADAQKSGVIREVLPLAKQKPVIGVRAGNPKNIRTVADLLRDDVKVALANPEAASISRVARTVLGETWTKLAAHAAVMKPTVTEIAADLALGTVDAAIVWDSIVGQFKVEAIEVPELSARSENASATVLEFFARSPRPRCISPAISPRRKRAARFSRRTASRPQAATRGPTSPS